MFVRTARLFAVTALAAGLVAAATAVPSGAFGPGAFTKITTPSGNLRFHLTTTNNQFAVSGQTSFDITAVDILCLFGTVDGLVSTSLATNVPVSGGAFSATATLTTAPANCRLRAVPTGDAITNYLGSFSGPLLYTDQLQVLKDGATPYSYTAVAEEASGLGVINDAGKCGDAGLNTITTPEMELEGPNISSCRLSLPGSSLSPLNTASGIRIDGHNAYLPAAVHSLLRGTDALPVAQSTLTASMTIATNGDVTVTESAPLMRCTVSDTYPPNSTSCPALEPTGVKFMRVSTFFRSGHQIHTRDTFSSTNAAAHTLFLEYQNQTAPLATGVPGYTYPSHGTTFTAPTPHQSLSGFGTGSASMFIRSDLRASADDVVSADTTALTWSRPPAAIVFSADTYKFDMRYALGIAASGTTFLGFGYSENGTTAGANSLAALAVSDMMNAPSIVSPANGAVFGSTTTTVVGVVTAGANGLPTSVTVNGHTAAITKTNTTTATYRVTFTEAAGKHTITATAHDAVGNAKSTSITVTNK